MAVNEEIIIMDKDYLHIDDCPSTIAREWLDRGQRETDELYKFVSYWIVFNHLYNYGIDDFDEIETIRIKDFCKKHSEVLAEVLDFNAEYLKPLKERPVIPGPGRVGIIDWKGDVDYLTERIYEIISRNRESSHKEEISRFVAKDYQNICNPKAKLEYRVESLIMTIYRIRCNLFHGMKSGDPGRDYELVVSAEKVLDCCLPALIKDTFWRI